jgi:hypothetical protein
MECLKYHFEPFALKKPDGEYDFELIREILPKIYRKPLYQKFGAFYGVKSLNLKPPKVIGASAALDEEKPVYHPETGLEAEREEYQFIVINPVFVYCLVEQNYKPIVSKKARRLVLENAFTLKEAVKQALNKFIFPDITALEKLDTSLSKRIPP